MHGESVHTCVPPPTHAPFPSHRLGSITTLPEHAAGEQITVFEYFSQAPAPLQDPVLPHVLVGSVGHSLSGSVSAATLLQVPSAPEPFFVAEQASHVPEQARSQQTASTQKPLRHWSAAVHDAPVVCLGRHEP